MEMTEDALIGDADIHSQDQKWSLGGLVPVKACPACGSAERSGSGIPSVDSMIRSKGDIWRMQQCQSCRSLYLDPRPDHDSLILAYGEYKTHNEVGPEREFEQSKPGLWALAVDYLNYRFRLRRPHANSLGRHVFRMAIPWRQKLDYYGRHLFPESFANGRQLLDVGCGNGAFLSLASEMGWEVLGIDPDPIGVGLCQKKGMPAIQCSLATMPAGYAASFDVVTLSHSIEHVDDMHADLARVHDLLRPAGVLWLATPNPRSLGFRWFGRGWRGLHPPYHLCIPSQQALEAMLSSVGFEQVRFIRRGTHARRAFRESADHAREVGLSPVKAGMASLIGVLSDLLASVSVGLAEETVVVARKRA